MSTHPSLNGARVASVRTANASYDEASESWSAHLASLGTQLGWAIEGTGAFGAAIPLGARVVVKPNWVKHANDGPWGIDPLITHASLVKAVVTEVLRSGAGSVVVGDAPLQICDFAQLVESSGLAAWAEALSRRDARFLGLRDFRRTRSSVVGGLIERAGEQVAIESFVLFDLAHESLLEPVTGMGGEFRVTCYPPDLMRRTHAPGRHQYLVAREVIDADVVINLPKLKTHRKAGVTCALKNLVGINGNKEFLPHHRLGGSEHGGDCYPGRSVVKAAMERTLDVENASDRRAVRHVTQLVGRALGKVAHLQGDRLGVDGAWSGNDTVWRMCLDLNRILLYGDTSGALHETPRRRVLHIVDAVIGGHGDGPLAPQPLPLGLLLAGDSAAAVDLISTEILGYDPDRIPITRGAFGRFSYPICTFDRADVTLSGDAAGTRDRRSPELLPADMSYPVGWVDAVAPGHTITEASPLPHAGGSAE